MGMHFCPGSCPNCIHYFHYLILLPAYLSLDSSPPMYSPYLHTPSISVLLYLYYQVQHHPYGADLICWPWTQCLNFLFLTGSMMYILLLCFFFHLGIFTCMLSHVLFTESGLRFSTMSPLMQKDRLWIVFQMQFNTYLLKNNMYLEHVYHKVN